MPDLYHQNFDTVQSNQQPNPVTVASAGTITPTTFMTIVSGTAAVATITPPVTGQHMLAFVPTGAFTTTLAGNIAKASTAVVGQVLLMFYDPNTGKYNPSY
jgi:hypothetical protein